jgi:death-on-curing protein
VTHHWVVKSVVLAIHDEQVAEHGGIPGIRDENGIEAVLARPLDLVAYSTSDISDLAAAYACGFAQRQYFNDGNKRVSLVVTELFLELNGWTLEAGDQELIQVWWALASSKMTEKELAAWIRQHSARAVESK